MDSLGNLSTLFAIVLAVLATSTLSGVLGMGGGIILMGVLAIFLPVREAMLLHGVAQLTANGLRTALMRRHVVTSVLLWYGLGAVGGFALLAVFQFETNKRTIYFLMGVFPFLQMLIPHLRGLTILKKSHATVCGFIMTCLQIIAGASGPVLDTFFAKRYMSKHSVVATKAATQVFGHLSKLAYYTFVATGTSTADHALNSFQWHALALALVAALLGTLVGNRLMESVSEERFHRASRALILLIGSVYVVLAFK